MLNEILLLISMVCSGIYSEYNLLHAHAHAHAHAHMCMQNPQEALDILADVVYDVEEVVAIYLLGSILNQTELTGMALPINVCYLVRKLLQL